MVDPITGAAIASGIFSALGGLSQNKAITKAATAQYNANKLFIEREQAVEYNQNSLIAQSLKDSLGINLTNIQQQGTKASAYSAANRTEQNIFGNTAQRQANVIDIRTELTKDAAIQQAEAQMMDVQNAQWSTFYKTQQAHAQNTQAYNNSMNQRQSSLSIMMNAVSAGVGTYSAGLQIQGMKQANVVNKTLAAGQAANVAQSAKTNQSLMDYLLGGN